MYKLQNGWTKESMKARIIERVPRDYKCMSGAECCYLDHNGKTCAVGAFIPDKHEGQDFEGQADLLLDNFPDLIASMPLEEEGLMNFQNIHDNYNDISSNRRPLHDVLCDWIDNNVKE